MFNVFKQSHVQPAIEGDRPSPAPLTWMPQRNLHLLDLLAIFLSARLFVKLLAMVAPGDVLDLAPARTAATVGVAVAITCGVIRFRLSEQAPK